MVNRSMWPMYQLGGRKLAIFLLQSQKKTLFTNFLLLLACAATSSREINHNCMYRKLIFNGENRFFARCCCYLEKISFYSSLTSLC